MAGIKMSLEFKGLNEAIKTLNQLSAKKADAVEKELNRTALAIESKAKRTLQKNNSIDTGQLWSETVRANYGQWKKTVNAHPVQAYFVEFGRRAGGKMPRHEHIAGWLARHNIPDKASFLIRRKIAKQGIRPKPFLFPAAEAERANFVRNLTVIFSRP